MSAVTLDTHAHVKRLVGAGMSETQAEAVINALKQTAELPDISHLATKADLQITKAELQTSIAEVRAEVKGVRGELIWWIIGTGVVSAASHLFFK